MADNESCDFHYECHLCKRLVPGHNQNAEDDEVIMVREKPGSPNWLFKCFACYYDLW